MRVLVTGGAGYVGSVTVERLVEAGHRVVVLDDLSTGHRGAVVPKARLVVGRYDDRDAVVALLGEERIDAVLHCAA
jgi:UDP-glucose 4-epimerase